MCLLILLEEPLEHVNPLDLVEHYIMFARSNFHGKGQAAIHSKAIPLIQT